MVTAYDYPSAKVAEEAGVDIVLVGDTAAIVVLGYDRHRPVSMDEMIVLGKAVRRGLKRAADGRRHADGQLRGEQRARHPQRPAAGQGDRLPGGQARGRRHLGRARPGDRPRRHPGDGPRRPRPRRPRPRSAATRPRARRRRRRSNCARTRWRCSRSAASRSSSRRSRRRSPRRSSRSSRCRRSGSAPGRRPRARSSSSTTCSASPPGTWRNSSSATPTSTTRWSTGSAATPRRSAARRFPGPDHVYGIEPAELAEFRRYLDQEALASKKAWEWEPLP